MGNVEVASTSMLAFDLLVLLSIFLLGTGEDSVDVGGRFVYLAPLIMVAAIWALTPTVAERFQNWLVEQVEVVVIGDPVLKIDPIQGYRGTVQVAFTNRRSNPLLVAASTCDWCVLSSRILDGSVAVQPGETKTIKVELIRQPSADNTERAEMEQDARKGLAITKVPEQIRVNFSLLPNR